MHLHTLRFVHPSNFTLILWILANDNNQNEQCIQNEPYNYNHLSCPYQNALVMSISALRFDRFTFMMSLVCHCYNLLSNLAIYKFEGVMSPVTPVASAVPTVEI